MQDDPKNISNIVGTLFFEKFEFEEMREYLIKKSAPLHKCRSKLVKHFGMWWFKDLTNEEFERDKYNIFIRKDGIHTTDDLNKYMCELETTRDPYNTC
mgnify:CR=1 FL=1|tara:strand:+ start:61 stop:354 length:294 start_codon:yes stop_codon:yes gene_type:complete